MGKDKKSEQREEDSSSLQQNDKMKAKKRTKKIQKPSESVEINRGRRGRPKTNRQKSDDDSEDQKYVQTDIIKNSFLKYMNDIKYKKGLVFNEGQRAQLRKEQAKQGNKLPKIQWDAHHFWNQKEEQEKAKRIINEIVGFPEEEQQKVNKLVTDWLQICDIFPRQITGEGYKILSEIYKRIKELPKEESSLKEVQQSIGINYAKQIYQKRFEEYYLLTDNFSMKFKLSGNVDIEKKLCQMLKTMTKYMRELMDKK